MNLPDHEAASLKVEVAAAAAHENAMRNERTNRHLYQLLLFGLLAMLAVTVTFGVISLNKEDAAHTQTVAILNNHSATIRLEQETLRQAKATLAQIKALNSPAAIKAEEARIVAVEKLVVLCIENHEDQDARAAVGLPVPPTIAGCPTQIPPTHIHHKAKKR